jgi:hypothetical protein
MYFLCVITKSVSKCKVVVIEFIKSIKGLMNLMFGRGYQLVVIRCVCVNCIIFIIGTLLICIMKHNYRLN